MGRVKRCKISFHNNLTRKFALICRAKLDQATVHPRVSARSAASQRECLLAREGSGQYQVLFSEALARCAARTVVCVTAWGLLRVRLTYGPSRRFIATRVSAGRCGVARPCLFGCLGRLRFPCGAGGQRAAEQVASP